MLGHVEATDSVVEEEVRKEAARHAKDRILRKEEVGSFAY